MSHASELLRELGDLGISVWGEAGSLRYRAPSGRLSPDLLARLKASKPDLLALLAANDPPLGFWERLALSRPLSLAFTNHLMACPRCHAPKGRYCATGQQLKADYEAEFDRIWQ